MIRHEILYQQLKKEIIMGVFKDGDILPSEHRLSDKNKISRHTVRQTLNRLLAEGYIVKHKGKGSIVNMKRNRLGLLSFKGFSESLNNSSIPVNTIELIKPQACKWPEPFFYPLSEKEINAGCIFLKRIRKAGDEKVMLESTYIPNQGIKGFESDELTDGSLFATLRKHNQIEVISVEQDLRAVVADKQLADLFDVPVNHPLIHIYRCYSTSREDFFLYSSLFCNTEKYFISNLFNHTHL